MRKVGKGDALFERNLEPKRGPNIFLRTGTRWIRRWQSASTGSVRGCCHLRSAGRWSQSGAKMQEYHGNPPPGRKTGFLKSDISSARALEKSFFKNPVLRIPGQISHDFRASQMTARTIGVRGASSPPFWQSWSNGGANPPPFGHSWSKG